MKKILFLLLCTTTVAWSTDLTGKVQGYNALTRIYYPIDRITVELGNYNAARQWVRVALSVTDNNGRYNFYGIAPGTYALLVGNESPKPINVRNGQVQELPVIVTANPRAVYYQRSVVRP